MEGERDEEEDQEQEQEGPGQHLQATKECSATHASPPSPQPVAITGAEKIMVQSARHIVTARALGPLATPRRSRHSLLACNAKGS